MLTDEMFQQDYSWYQVHHLADVSAETRSSVSDELRRSL